MELHLNIIYILPRRIFDNTVMGQLSHRRGTVVSQTWDDNKVSICDYNWTNKNIKLGSLYRKGLFACWNHKKDGSGGGDETISRKKKIFE